MLDYRRTCVSPATHHTSPLQAALDHAPAICHAKQGRAIHASVLIMLCFVSKCPCHIECFIRKSVLVIECLYTKCHYHLVLYTSGSCGSKLIWGSRPLLDLVIDHLLEFTAVAGNLQVPGVPVIQAILPRGTIRAV